jgi:3'-5' exoribonuclease
MTSGDYINKMVSYLKQEYETVHGQYSFTDIYARTVTPLLKMIELYNLDEVRESLELGNACMLLPEATLHEGMEEEALRILPYIEKYRALEGNNIAEVAGTQSTPQLGGLSDLANLYGQSSALGDAQKEVIGGLAVDSIMLDFEVNLEENAAPQSAATINIQTDLQGQQYVPTAQRGTIGIETAKPVEPQQQVESQKQMDAQPKNKEYLLDMCDFKDAENFSKYAYCANAVIVPNSKNKDNFVATLRDCNGTLVTGRMFSGFGDIDLSTVKEKVVHITGRYSDFEGRKTIVLTGISAANTQFTVEDFIKQHPENVSQSLQRFTELMSTVTTAGLKEVMEYLLIEKKYLEKMSEKAGGIGVHHTGPGDLLVHSADVGYYTYLRLLNSPKHIQDRGVLGGLLHDIGKVHELPNIGNTQYSLEGELFGHSVIGYSAFVDACKVMEERGTPVGREDKYSLMHIFLSHHGTPEHGAVVPPKTLEAVTVCKADSLDAKPNQYITLYDTMVDGSIQRTRTNETVIKL